MFSQPRLYTFFLGVFFAVFAAASVRADSNDPPGRAARLSYTHGATSFSPAGETEWVDTVVNRPLISGDRLWSDSDGRAEIEVGSSALRLDANTNFELVYLDDRTTQVQVTQGTLNVSLRHFSRDQTFEIDTPTLALTLEETGRYRVEVDPDGHYTTVAIMHGSAVARGENAQYPLQAGDRVRFHQTNLRDAEQLNAFAADDFDRFCATRDDRAEHAASLQYVGTDVVGAYDLDEYGSWSSQRDYGHVWYPSHVDANWAPYSDGHWIWQDPWGWTWVDNAPWGFAPSHYGRWVSIDNRWGWVPGPREDHAIYAPALVAFVGGAGFSIGISIGGGTGPVGWFPLGARDVYAPPYHASHDYFTRVNVTNTTINNTYITNVYNDYSSGRPLTQETYANRTVPGAVIAVPGNVFANAQPVRAAAVRVDQKALASARIMPMAAVAPSARSVIGNAPVARAKPAETVLERKVVAQTPPPPKPVPFAARQQELQRTPGRPLTPSAITALQPGGAAAAAPNVRVLGRQPGAVNVRTAGPAKAAPEAGTKPPSPQISAPPAESRRTGPTPPQQERTAPPAEEKRAAPPQQQERKTAPTPPQQERTAPPAEEKRGAPPQQQERKAPPVEQPKRTVPTPPHQERTAPPAEEKRATPQQQQQEQPQERKAQKQQQQPPPQQQQERKAPPVEQPKRVAPPQQQQLQQPQQPQQQRKAPPAQQKAKDAEKKDAEKKDAEKKDAEKKDADKKEGGGNSLPGS